MDTNQKQLFDLVKKKAGVDNVQMDDSLEYDLGLTGDDANELIMEYSKKFKIEVSQFDFNQYFHSEGNFILFFFSKINRKQRKRRISIRTLVNGIEKRVLE